jgi:hypothetical protein
MKLSSRVKKFLVMAGVLSLIGLLTQSGVSIHSKGMAKGCDKLAKLAIDPMVSPECVMDKGQLLLIITHPFTGEQKMYDVNNGKEI